MYRGVTLYSIGRILSLDYPIIPTLSRTHPREDFRSAVDAARSKARARTRIYITCCSLPVHAGARNRNRKGIADSSGIRVPARFARSVRSFVRARQSRARARSARYSALARCHGRVKISKSTGFALGDGRCGEASPSSSALPRRARSGETMTMLARSPCRADARVPWCTRAHHVSALRPHAAPQVKSHPCVTSDAFDERGSIADGRARAQRRTIESRSFNNIDRLTAAFNSRIQAPAMRISTNKEGELLCESIDGGCTRKSRELSRTRK